MQQTETKDKTFSECQEQVTKLPSIYNLNLNTVPVDATKVTDSTTINSN